MRKLVLVFLTCIAAFALFLCIPIHEVHAEAATLVVTLGDSAPIPYLEGFQSRLLQDANAISGVTGAVGLELRNDEYDSESWDIQLQNIVLTDDVIGLFFKQSSSNPIPYEGDFPYAYSWEVRSFNILIDGKALPIINEFCEGHPIDANSQYSMVLWSLKQPIKTGQTLTVGARWNEAKHVYEGGTVLNIDRSKAKDPTVAYKPALTVQKTFMPWKGEKPVDYNFTIERVAFTPFGNRMLIAYRGTCEANQYLDYSILDENGDAMPVDPPIQAYNTDASKEHPALQYNETWFFGGETSKSLTIVPVGSESLNGSVTSREVAVTLDSLPADVPLENGTTLHIENCDVTKDGFYTLYTANDYTGYLDFDLGDGDARSLQFNFITYNQCNPVRHLLGVGGYWSDEYKGKTVSRVTQEELTRVKTLIIHYDVGDHWLMTEEAIPVVLTK